MKLIFKKNFNPLTHEVEVKTTDTGKELRAYIAKIEGCDADEIQVKFYGDVVPDDVTVAEYKMKDQDSILYLVNRKKVKTDGGDGQITAEPAFITLTLKNVAGGDDLTIQAVPEDSVAILRVKVEEQHNIPANAIRFKYNGMFMFPAKNLQGYDIHQNVTLDMMVDEKIAAEERAKAGTKKPEEAQKTSEVKVKVKFHDGEEKELNVDIDDTMEELRKKLLNLKPLDEAKSKDFRLKVIVAGEEAKDQAKLKDLGLKAGNATIATQLERVKGENDIRLLLKRVAVKDPEVIIIDKNQTVEALKKTLEAKLNATVSEITLQFNSKDLENQATLENIGLVDDSTVNVSIMKKSLFSNPR